jgi:fructuronate reductase
MTKRLSEATRGDLPAKVAQPAYDRAACGIGIVHLGIGAFHRAHQAVYTDDMLARRGGDWAIHGVSLRSPEVRDQLGPQDGLYTLAERGPEGEALRVVGAVKAITFAQEAPAAVIGAMAMSSTRVVSLTVTEKGYYHDPASGRLLADHPDIRHDLGEAALPRTVLGYLLAGLRSRRSVGAPPFTVLCCDNLPHNGRLLRGLVLELAAAQDPALAGWIESEVRFPSTMVDRIVPATTEDDRDRLAERLGLRDEGLVVAEPFRQWVIEDDFANGRPAWEEAGAEMVGDVAPYEEMKLRLLNGSHSLLAYLGYLAGYETIAETMADDNLRKLARAFMDREAGPTLKMPAGANLEGYKAALIERFANPGLRHRTWQIAMDGSQKLPQRLLGTLAQRLAEDAPIDILALAVAAWMRYVGGRDEKGREIDVRDPLAARLASVYAAGGTPAGIVAGILEMREIFDTELAGHSQLRDQLTSALTELINIGSRAAVAATLQRICS